MHTIDSSASFKFQCYYKRKWYVYENIYASQKGVAPLQLEQGEKVVKSKVTVKKWLWW